MNHQINIKTLTYRVVKKWRFILISIIVMAFLAGVVSLVKSFYPTGSTDMFSKTQGTDIEEEKHQLLKGIEQIKADLIEVDFLISEKMDDELPMGREYISEAFFAINLNLNLVPAMQDTIVLQSSDNSQNLIASSIYTTKLDEIKYLYFATINDLSLYDDIKEQLKIKISSDQLRKQVTQSYNNNSLLLQVNGFDAKTNISIRDAILKKIVAFEATLNRRNQIHTLELLRVSDTVIDGTAWQSIRMDARTEKQQLETKLATIELQLSNFPQPDLKVNRMAHNSMKTILFYISVGIILGLIIGVVLVFIQILFSMKIWTIEDIENEYTLPVLGEFSWTSKNL